MSDAIDPDKSWLIMVIDECDPVTVIIVPPVTSRFPLTTFTDYENTYDYEVRRSTFLRDKWLGDTVARKYRIKVAPSYPVEAALVDDPTFTVIYRVGITVE